MKVIFQKDAQEQLFELTEFIDDINTPGAGVRWLEKFITFCTTYGLSNVQYALCQNQKWAEQLLSCIVYHNWVVGFKIEKGNFVVYQIAHGSMLY